MFISWEPFYIEDYSNIYSTSYGFLTTGNVGVVGGNHQSLMNTSVNTIMSETLYSVRLPLGFICPATLVHETGFSPALACFKLIKQSSMIFGW